MILYHGSTELVDTPEIRTGNIFLDFGFGFYTTTSYNQAERWAKIKMRRNSADKGYVSVYEFDFDNASKEIDVITFKAADEKWLEFVVDNRNGRLSNNTVDLITGPVADDNIYETIRLFETGAYDAEYTVRKLKTEVLHDQWAFRTDKVLGYLKFVEAKEIV